MGAPRHLGQPHQVWSWSGPPQLEVLAREVTTASGEQQTWHLLQAQSGVDGAVCVPVHDARVLLARIWRWAADGWSLELPRGFGEEGEDPVATARRELREESGLEAEGCRLLGRVHADSGLLAGAVNVVECGVADPSSQARPDGELDSWRWLDEGELSDVIRNGGITDGLTLAALTLYRAHQTDAEDDL